MCEAWCSERENRKVVSSIVNKRIGVCVTSAV
jgi:hypothetical protein